MVTVPFSLLNVLFCLLTTAVMSVEATETDRVELRSSLRTSAGKYEDMFSTKYDPLSPKSLIDGVVLCCRKALRTGMLPAQQSYMC